MGARNILGVWPTWLRCSVWVPPNKNFIPPKVRCKMQAPERITANTHDAMLPDKPDAASTAGGPRSMACLLWGGTTEHRCDDLISRRPRASQHFGRQATMQTPGYVQSQQAGLCAATVLHQFEGLLPTTCSSACTDRRVVRDDIRWDHFLAGQAGDPKKNTKQATARTCATKMNNGMWLRKTRVTTTQARRKNAGPQVERTRNHHPPIEVQAPCATPATQRIQMFRHKQNAPCNRYDTKIGHLQGFRLHTHTNMDSMETSSSPLRYSPFG